MIIELADGRTFNVAKIRDTWHVAIDGQAYCASSLELLVLGLARQFRLANHVETPPQDPIKEALFLLQSQNSSLQQRQIAIADLRNLAEMGNSEAQALVRLLDAKRSASPHAQAVAMKLGKNDFSEVTHEELVKHVNDLVLRSKLILELSDRVRLS